MLLKILGNVIKDSGECSRGFHGMFEKIPGNFRRFQGILLKILENVRADSRESKFLEILLVFYQILQLNCYESMEKTITEQFF